MNIIYDTAFNTNEWTVLSIFFIGGILYIILPKIFTSSLTMVHMLFGVVVGLMFDHTIAILPIDLYDVGDESKYQLFDLFSYTMYSPVGYLYIYLYEKLRLPTRNYWSVVIFIVVWSTVGVAVEWLGVLTGIFHYKNGYQLVYSFPVYLFVQAIQIWLHHFLSTEK